LICIGKNLSRVELPGKVSHQHELAIIKAALPVFSGSGVGRNFLHFLFLEAGGDAIFREFVEVYYYDCRASKEDRDPEFRLYYEKSIDDDLGMFAPDDRVYYAKDVNRRIFAIFLSRNRGNYVELCNWLESLSGGLIKKKTPEEFANIFSPGKHYIIEKIENFVKVPALVEAQGAR